ncbi:MAG: MFS transporter [Acidimicrobiia bacterium]
MTAPAPSRLVTTRFLLVVVTATSYFLALGVLLPTFPKFVDDELGGSSLDVGIAVGAFALGAIILRPYLGRVGDRVGCKPLILGGAAVVTGSLLLLVVAQSLPLAVLARFLGGLGEAAFFTGAATMATDLAPFERRGEAISFFSVAVYGGTAFGPFIGEAIRSAYGFQAVWWAAFGFAAFAVVLGSWTRESHRRKGESAAGLPLLNRRALVPGGVLFLSLFALTAVTTFGALYAATLGIANAGPLFLLYGVLVLGIRVFGARIPDRIGSARGSTVSCVLCGLALIVLAAVPSVAGVYIAVVVLALGMALQYPSLLLLALSGVDQSESASVVGTFGAFFDLASGVAPVVLGTVVALANYRSAFAVGVVFCIGGVALLWSGIDPRVRVLRASHPDEGAAAIEPPPGT